MKTILLPWTLIGICLPLLSGTALANEDGTPHYFYCDKGTPIALELDASRIAIFDPTYTVSVGCEAALASAAITPADVTAYPIDGWFIATVPPSLRSADGVETLVATLVTTTEDQFFGPVFLDQRGGPVVVTPQILVGFNQDVDAASAAMMLAAQGAGEIQKEWTSFPGMYVAGGAARDGFEMLSVANRLALHRDTRFAHPNMIVRVRTSATIPDDPLFPYCWGLHNEGEDITDAPEVPDIDMDAPEAWDVTTGNPVVIVAVLDVGVQLDHPDLHVSPNGVDFTGQGSGGWPVTECDNHGTCMAGCISALINNGRDVAGVAPGCLCASARVAVIDPPCDEQWHYSEYQWWIDALDWAVDQGARVTCNALNHDTYIPALATAYQQAYNSGLVHIGAAGNDGLDGIIVPAAYDYVNGVSAVMPDGTLWPDSNHSTALAFSAPGYWIWTTDRTDGEGYDPENEVYSIDGTSPACAFAAGVAALVFSMNTSFTPAQVEEILYQSCMDIGAPGHDEEFGWGLVNAHKAVQAAEPDITWIDFSFAGPNVGTFFYPYDTLADAVNAAPAGRTVRMKPSSSTETITITQSITLEAWNGPVTIGG